MQKPLREIAEYLKSIIPAEIPEAYPVNPVFSDIADNETIYRGVLAYRDFLYQLFDYIIADAELYDNPKKVSEKTTDTVNLELEYPFLRNISVVLVHMGIYGELNKNGDALILSGSQLHAVLKGARVTKSYEYLRHLSDCGVYFSGIDLNQKKPDLSNAGQLEITYPDCPVMLAGLKILAEAQLKDAKNGLNPRNGSYTASIDTIFLRCDYRALGENKIQPVFVFEDAVRALPAKMQDYLLKLHKKYMDMGCKYSCKYLCMHMHFSYSYKKCGVIASINLSPADGCVLKINAKNISDYTEMVKDFPAPLMDAVTNGHDCGKMQSPENCKPNCRGYEFTIDGKLYLKCKHLNFYIPLVDLSYGRAIEDWIDKEILYLQDI